MTISLKHKFTSAKADGGDSALVKPTNWNDEHDLLCASGVILGRITSGAGAAEELGIDYLNDPIVVACSDETTALTLGVKVTFRMPSAFTLTEVPRASLTTAQTSGTDLIVDIKEAGTSIMTTSKLRFDNGEKTTVSSSNQPALTDTSLANDAEITVEITQIGDGTAKGLKVMLIGRRG